MRRYRVSMLDTAAAFVVLGPQAPPVGAVRAWNFTDPTVFAPKCLAPSHRSYRHCLDASTVGGVTLTGTTHTIDLVSGGEYRFSVTTPPLCPADLQAPHAPCTISINWAVAYGASLADWGISPTEFFRVDTTSGCDGNDRTCDFTVGAGPPGLPPLENGTAPRVTAVAYVFGSTAATVRVSATTGWTGASPARWGRAARHRLDDAGPPDRRGGRLVEPGQLRARLDRLRRPSRLEARSVS